LLFHQWGTNQLMCSLRQSLRKNGRASRKETIY